LTITEGHGAIADLALKSSDNIIGIGRFWQIMARPQLNGFDCCGNTGKPCKNHNVRGHILRVEQFHTFQTGAADDFEIDNGKPDFDLF
jgi:hypothetical protein